jgi:hypothetical protein
MEKGNVGKERRDIGGQNAGKKGNNNLPRQILVDEVVGYSGHLVQIFYSAEYFNGYT